MKDRLEQRPYAGETADVGHNRYVAGVREAFREIGNYSEYLRGNKTLREGLTKLIAETPGRFLQIPTRLQGGGKIGYTLVDGKITLAFVKDGIIVPFDANGFTSFMMIYEDQFTRMREFVKEGRVALVEINGLDRRIHEELGLIGVGSGGNR